MTDDDRLVAEVLHSKGMMVTPAVWDAPDVNWSHFACAVIRSTWDYHRRPDQYAEWLDRRSSDGTRLWNPPKAVLANLNKRYLSDLARQGIEVVPTAYIPRGEPPRLRRFLEHHQWREAVVKPEISAGADGTWPTSLATADADQARFEQQVHAQGVLIQPYLSEVASQGEWSLVFFAGEYSHAALKKPAPGDIRVQPRFGGTTVDAKPPARLVEQARTILSQVDSELLYARVDGIDRAGRFVLMELEINEPHLFIFISVPNETDEERVLRLAETIQRIRSGSTAGCAPAERARRFAAAITAVLPSSERDAACR
jgi:hypothetical protein